MNGSDRSFAKDSDVEDKLFLLESKVRTLELLFREKDEIEDEGLAESNKSGTLSSISTSSIDISYDDDMFDSNPKLGSPLAASPTSTRLVPRSSSQFSPSKGQLRRSRRLFEQSTVLRPEIYRRPSVIEEELDQDDDYKDLSQDTFSLMILARPGTSQWWFGFLTFLLQISLLLMIVINQYSSSKGSTPFDIPYKVDPVVHAGQFLALMLSLATQTDLVMSIITFMMLWTERRVYWTKLIKAPEDSSLWIWVSRIAFPIACEFLEGFFVLVATFVIVIQSNNIIDLFKDFAAMQLISEFDNMMFWLALHGYMGTKLAGAAKQARKIKIHDDVIKAYGGIPLRTLILMVVCGTMIGCWGYIVNGQVTGKFFSLKYPLCNIDQGTLQNMGDGVCDGGYLNTRACGFDDGDCITFNLAYPNCKINEPFKIGNGECDQEYNDKDCLYDGDDCCALEANDFSDQDLHGDGFCNGGVFNTEVCGFDGGDCVGLNSKYPNCPILLLTDIFHEPFYPHNEFPALGDGKCDGAKFNVKECGYDDGDCVTCNELVEDPKKIGDGYCDGGIYLDAPECNDDGGDCSFFVEEYPDCHVPEPELVGNGHCDGSEYMNPNCLLDGGDCEMCNVTYVDWVGDGICDGMPYISEGCSYDGGDCTKCVLNATIDIRRIANGICDPELNTTECSWDGFDCIDAKKDIPCIVDDTALLGDGYCHGGSYNSPQCDFDGGDCIECNSKVWDISKIGDGICQGGNYNSEVCGWDAGDCIDFNTRYPDCHVPHPYRVADGFCDGNVYFVEACGNDGFDCSGCNVEKPAWIGDGFCDGGDYLSLECSFDAGDCAECIETTGVDPMLIGDGKCNLELNTTMCGYDGHDCLATPVKCSVPDESLLGDGKCNGGVYNTAVCGYDGGDCVICNAKVSAEAMDRIGDGVCHSDILLVEECSLDGEDCLQFFNLYPDCDVQYPEKVGDNTCDPVPYYTEECGWDGGDCDSCQVEDRSQLGNGICNGGDYVLDGCAEDAGDCSRCLLLTGGSPKDLGDGYCDIAMNTTECNWDAGDCLGSNLCNVERKDYLGDSFCDGGQYNTEECNWDGGDCVQCNAVVEDPTKIGDGYCDGGLYMEDVSCYKDGKDCSSFLSRYPNCKVDKPELVGNGQCDGSSYYSPSCGWDGGDCSECNVADLSNVIGNGICDGNALSNECGWDGGDCDLCIEMTGADPKDLGDNYCDLELNTTECNLDASDCVGPYANCNVPNKNLLGDGQCQGGVYNTEECGWDFGDCSECNEIVEDPSKLGNSVCDSGLYKDHPSCFADGGDCNSFLEEYPNCEVPNPSWINNGKCDGLPYFTEECGLDGGDCASCEVPNPALLNDGVCNGPPYTSEACGFDGGDCDACFASKGDLTSGLNDLYCDIELNTTECGYDGGDCLEYLNPRMSCSVEDKSKLGDGVCDGGEYNTEECEWDYLDCALCNEEVPAPEKLGDGYCDGGLYMKLSVCAEDAGDCSDFISRYPECNVPFPDKVGDGNCDPLPYFTAECGNDGGDCRFCNVKDKSLLGNNICNGNDYSSKACSYDSQDCVQCLEEIGEENMKHVGDGYCDLEFNTTACSFDGLDCLQESTCQVPMKSKLGNGLCDGGEYNTEECGWDDGDCIVCNSAVNNRARIGDGRCDGYKYLNMKECNLDGGDCIEFIEKYPDCQALRPFKIGDGTCDGGEYNTEACGFDEGDCDRCQVSDLSILGDGQCNGGDTLTEECAFDAGDCSTCLELIEFMDGIEMDDIGDNYCDEKLNIRECSWDGGDCSQAINCQVPDKTKLGDGRCDGGQYNNEACNWDGGDCIECNSIVPNPARLGDNKCDGLKYMKEESCNYDGGDCIEFLDEYPLCKAKRPFRIGNSFCDGGAYFTPECGLDGGDCEFCQADPKTVNNGRCDGGLNMSPGCSFDGGDCDACIASKPHVNPNKIGDGNCELWLNTTECSYDGGDCIGLTDSPTISPTDHPSSRPTPAPTKKFDPYPGCNVNRNSLGDGKCDGGRYNTEKCGWDGGDCVQCNNIVNDRTKIGDGRCDGGKYMRRAACNEDGGDCKEFLDEYPNCNVAEPWRIGNNVCDGFPYSHPSCGYDGGDCTATKAPTPSPTNAPTPQPTTKAPSPVAPSPVAPSPVTPSPETPSPVPPSPVTPSPVAPSPVTLSPVAPSPVAPSPVTPSPVAPSPVAPTTKAPSPVAPTTKAPTTKAPTFSPTELYPDCIVDHWEKLGNNRCDGSDYNTEECGWDGGDCIQCNSIVEHIEWIGDNFCDGGIYMNHPSCNKDGKDCASFLNKYPNCNVPTPGFIGNGVCNGDLYNTEECGWDGGDCLGQCFVEHPAWIGDGWCDGGDYLAIECSRDGGDCDDCIETYDVDPNIIGDGVCQLFLNVTKCGYDGGDCLGVDETPQECTVDHPEYLGDGYCDGGDYYTEACDWDHGDCDECVELIDDPDLIGDGECNQGYNITECYYDGGDCLGEEYYMEEYY